MEKDEIEKSIKRYGDRYRQFGYDCRTLGWSSRESQQLRFKVLQEIGNLDGRRILDVGCGFGDFYDFLRAQGLRFDYTGYDISQELIDEARRKFPEAGFHVRNINDVEGADEFDYVVASGLLNLKVRDNWNFLKTALRKMYGLSRLGTAVNMMTDYVDYEVEDLYYYNPEKTFGYCKSLTRYVTLRHDYPLYEFTVYLYKSGSDDHEP